MGAGLAPRCRRFGCHVKDPYGGQLLLLCVQSVALLFCSKFISSMHLQDFAVIHFGAQAPSKIARPRY